MMNTGYALHPALKLDACRVLAGDGFQVFCCAEFCKHLPTDAALFRSGRHATRLVSRPVRVALHPDIFLLAAAQLLCQIPHHALMCGRLQTRQERI
ncbi:hypothetical protein P823_05256 [Klebsiella pneumoniae UCI 20]|nr:hypothetical protein P823_05256 [Klebsiella pneumoniae UCI 20]